MVNTLNNNLNFSKNIFSQTIEISTEVTRKISQKDLMTHNEKLPRRIRQCPKTIHKTALQFKHSDFKI